MVSKVWAIGKKSELVALKYGKNVSQGILKMEEQIQKYLAFIEGKFKGV